MVRDLCFQAISQCEVSSFHKREGLSGWVKALTCVICAQGRVRTKTVKKASRVLVEKYYSRLTLDFDTNKRVAEDVASIQTKRLRNKIAGFTTVRPEIHLAFVCAMGSV